MPSRISGSVRQAASLASITWLTGRPSRSQTASSSAPVVNG